MSAQNTPRIRLPYLVPGQAQKEVTHNEALALIDAGLGASAESIGLNAPPAVPVAGQCWIIGSAPTGAWTGQAHAVAVRTEGGWRFLAPAEGLRVWLKDQELFALRIASQWAVGDEAVSRLLIGGVQVVGPRLSAVPPPTGGAVIDAEARTAIAAMIDRLTAHGLLSS